MRFLAIQPRNILSFGPGSPELVLEPLNVLIGPNGSGKSNLIHVLALLQAAATDFATAIRENGDATHWIWRHGTGGPPFASVKATFSVGEDVCFEYELAFSGKHREPFVVREALRDTGRQYLATSTLGGYHTELYAEEDGSWTNIHDQPANQSALSRVDQPLRFPEVHTTQSAFAELSIYRDWAIGRSAPARRPQKPNLGSAVLNDDAGNLSLVLNQLNQDHAAKTRLLDALRELYDNITDFRVNIEHDSVKIVLREGDVEIPAARLSDGTLRYLCLLAILCHPRPPPVVCLEEPELGLHPDILPGLADLLKDASTRCQLIVTTHSDVLIDRLSDTPESVVVCEKHDGQTQMRRLEAGPLKQWLERYRLGELWTKGELGGNRW